MPVPMHHNNQLYISFSNLETPKMIDEGIIKMIDVYSRSIKGRTYDIPTLKSKLQELMWNNVGIIRTEEGLIKAQKEIERMKNNFKRFRKCLNRDEYEYRNMLTIASLIIESALSRKESRGAHSRADFKQTNDNPMHSNILKTDEKELFYVE